MDLHELAALLAIAPAEVSSDAPIELARAEFTHLMVPVGTLATMRRIRPDFSGLADYSRYLRVDTVCAFTRETVDPGNTVHCRDFCPAVGTPESPAAGTTNRGLACYLVRHALVDAPADGTLVVLAEQGHEMGRPSLIRTELTLAGGSVLAVRVGGVATRTLEGTLRAPSPPAATHGDEGARAE